MKKWKIWMIGLFVAFGLTAELAEVLSGAGPEEGAALCCPGDPLPSCLPQCPEPPENTQAAETS